MMHKGAIYLYMLLILVPGCRKQERNITDEEYSKTKEALVGVNRILVKKDSEKIKAYLKRHNWNMQQTESGLWYMILEQGTGKVPEAGKLITVDYTVDLLDGTHCYSSDSLGPKRFKIGQGGVESGLEEGILLLKEGARARLIIPPHLAHGLTGDGSRIPARAIIIYEINVRKIEY